MLGRGEIISKLEWRFVVTAVSPFSDEDSEEEKVEEEEDDLSRSVEVDLCFADQASGFQGFKMADLLIKKKSKLYLN